uniref:BTB domain-containing protein n=1 Tax=Panagrellus redivivus TaxID=6233 RepID=A0A7E4VP90_PANRE
MRTTTTNQLNDKVDKEQLKITHQIILTRFRHNFAAGKSFTSVITKGEDVPEPYLFFECYPNGDCEENKGTLCIKLHVYPEPRDVKMVYWIEGTEVRVENQQLAYSKSGISVTKVCTIEQITNSNIIVDNELKVMCEMTFTKPHVAVVPLAKKVETAVPMHALVKFNEPDFTVVVDDKEIMVHRNFISLISPVFRAMLEHDTIESKSNHVAILGFSFEVVKDVLDLCYGHRLKANTIDEIMQDLVFADMYCMSGVLESLSELLIAQLNTENFISIVKHAWTYSSDTLKKACCKFFKSDHVALALTQEFCGLDSEISLALLSSL